MVLLLCGYNSADDNIIRMIFRTILVCIWFVLFMFSSKTNLLSIGAFLATLYLLPFSGMWNLIPMTLFIVLICKKKVLYKYHIISIIVFIVGLISLFSGLIMQEVGSYLTNHIHEISTECYQSKDKSNEVKIYSYYIDGIAPYAYTLYKREGMVIELGVHRYKKFVELYDDRLLYEEDKSATAKWIDNDTFEFADEQYNIK